MDKKANWIWDNIGMLMIMLLVLIVAILFVYAMRERAMDIASKIWRLF
ncbi:MAG: hypothetical protein Q8R00_03675 [Candidatus Nanoarchaeia archaeon]|nr:hypothetical protein [Candidatus Nanoarchaeia archaeon]